MAHEGKRDPNYQLMERRFKELTRQPLLRNNQQRVNTQCNARPRTSSLHYHYDEASIEQMTLVCQPVTNLRISCQWYNPPKRLSKCMPETAADHSATAG
jgi:hypothetical protein